MNNNFGILTNFPRTRDVVVMNCLVMITLAKHNGLIHGLLETKSVDLGKHYIGNQQSFYRSQSQPKKGSGWCIAGAVEEAEDNVADSQGHSHIRKVLLL
jgi:hypothetical protein